jgi:hypothetical protein
MQMYGLDGRSHGIMGERRAEAPRERLAAAAHPPRAGHAPRKDEAEAVAGTPQHPSPFLRWRV